MRLHKNDWAMKMALVTAEMSTCRRRNVGCVLLNEIGHVLSTGYNGVASGLRHCNYVSSKAPQVFPYACKGADSPSGTQLDLCNAIHAEQNALLQCHNVQEVHAAYVTTSPCITCVKLLLNTTCRKIFFLEEYPHKQAKDLWVSSRRSWIRMVI